MTNVSHASLTGSQLHEPKGADSAALGTVYVSNGAGGGSWASVGTSAFTGMVADFIAPVVPAGWLELDGSTISTSTFSALYGTMAIQTSGTRTNGSPIITSISSTSTFKAGYFVFGTGIATGTTIVTIDSGTQITLSNNASSSGTAAFAVSPWVLNSGTITLPNVTAAGRYRRSRTASTAVGQFQADQNQAHTHPGVVDATNTDHTHGFSGNTGGQSADHSHNYTLSSPASITTGAIVNAGASNFFWTGGSVSTAATTGVNVSHTHAISGTTATANSNTSHVHTFTTGSTGAAEARPTTLVVITCVKT